MLSVIDPCTIDELRAVILAALETPTFRQHTLLIDRRHAELMDMGSLMPRRVSSQRNEDQAECAPPSWCETMPASAWDMPGFRVKGENPDVTLRTFRDYDRAVKWLTGR